MLAADRLKCQPWDFFDADEREGSRELWYTLALAARMAEVAAEKQKAEFANSWVPAPVPAA